METAAPVLQLPDGTRLVGRFEETVGTQLVLADTVGADGSHRVQLMCHTDKRICFASSGSMGAGDKALQAAPGGGDGGAEAAAAAAAAAASEGAALVAEAPS